MRRLWMIRLVALALLVAGGGASAAEDEVVSLSARVVAPAPPGGRALVRLDFSVREPAYVQRQQFRVGLAETAGAEGIEAGEPKLPPTETKYDEYLQQEVAYFPGDFTMELPLRVGAGVAPGTYDLTLDIRYLVCGEDYCRMDTRQPTVALTVAEGAASAGEIEAPPQEDLPDVQALEKTTSRFTEHGALVAILLAYVAGLGLCLTPCVYPLIPVTMSLVGATSGRSKLDGLVRSLVYVFGISLTYCAVGVMAALTGGLFGSVMQHPAVYVVLAVIFVLLAGAMFDWYTFDVASARLQQWQGRLRGKAGLVGIMLIGVLSGAAATACAAPIIAAIFAYVGQKGSVLMGLAMFFALAWGLGTPLVFLGTFTGLAQSLPKSGEWLVTVKHIFGLALLGAAVYFVGRSRLLSPVQFDLFVGGFLLCAGVFVGAFDVLSRRSGWWPRLRKAAGLLLVVAAVGFFLSAAGGLMPVPGGEEATESQVQWMNSEEAALARAEEEGRPVLLDFWAEWCPSCIHMLEETFRDPRVVEESGRFVCAKLDLTDTDTPEAVRLREKYNVRALPLTVFITPDGERQSHAGYIGPDRMLRLMRSVGGD